jgi:hypothetical protein
MNWRHIHADLGDAAIVRSVADGDETVPTVIIGPVALVNPTTALSRPQLPNTLRTSSEVAGLLGFAGQSRWENERSPDLSAEASSVLGDARLSVEGSGVVEFVNVDDLAALTSTELNASVDRREQCVVLADLDVVAWVEPSATLANDDRARGDLLTVERLHTEALCIGVAPVAG